MPVTNTLSILGVKTSRRDVDFNIQGLAQLGCCLWDVVTRARQAAQC